MTDREHAILWLDIFMKNKEPLVLIPKPLIRLMYDVLKNEEEIVRCKDCKHATMTSDGKMCKYCEMCTDDSGNQRDVYHDADWFCADGERREDDG